MSTRTRLAHSRAKQNNAMMTAPIARPSGEAGVSTISRPAGRNASSCLSRLLGSHKAILESRKIVRILADFMNSCLYAMQRRIAAAGLNEVIVRAVFDEATTVDR